MRPQHDEAETSVVLPVALQTLENIETTDRRFTSNMQRCILPRTQFASHVNKFWSLQISQTNPLSLGAFPSARVLEYEIAAIMSAPVVIHRNKLLT